MNRIHFHTKSDIPFYKTFYPPTLPQTHIKNTLDKNGTP